ncbi:defensin-like protein [Solanum verrucosum]|uniref:defensin-like protein n=1 Tax=Solanum verrucosum TaxID=315347 RepID=UPI0020D08EBC|nr:defensin-like protein [Solanum verrucosum]
MARSICFMVFLVLAIMLFDSYGLSSSFISLKRCKLSKFANHRAKPSKGCFTDSSCRKACRREEFTDGHCRKLLRKCLCTNICVFDKISNEVKTTLGGEAKFLSEAWLE